MALADRRPLAVASSHAAPAFNSTSDSSNLIISDLGKSYFENPTDERDHDENDEEIDVDVEENDENEENEHDEHDIDENDENNQRDVQNLAKSASPEVSPLSPTSRSISPDSLMNSGMLKKNASSMSSQNSISSRDSTPPTVQGGFYPKMNLAVLGKKPKQASRVPIATGISTTIPVTGEKPKPEQEGDASLEDDVLFAIFLILYEKDAEGAGMTVKQICDVLVERHPEMAQLSSKTSNLVSAKLNAYVKRVEKGDSNLKYALSREWADASPKRMVYVYRGLLAKDFHVHVKNAMESQKSQSGSLTFVNGSNSQFPADSFEAAKHSALSKPRRQTMFDLGISARPTFSDSSDSSHLFVPYSSAPVAANLKANTDADSDMAVDEDAAQAPKPSADSDFDFDDLEVFDTDDDDSSFSADVLKKNGKRSKSMSYLSVNKKTKYVTAAAAAPRAPKTPCSHSANAAAAAAALHAAALKAITASANGTISGPSKARGRSQSNWEYAVKSGFLVQEIDAPENVSLSDLDKYFS